MTTEAVKLYSSMRFEGDGVTTDVALTFDLRKDDRLTVDFGEGIVEGGYVVDFDSQPVLVIFDEPLPKDKTITIRRRTDIDRVPYVFQVTGNAQGGSPFNAFTIDTNFDLIVRASQDAMDSQVLASETLEEMAGIRDTAIDARDKAKQSEINSKQSELNSKDSELKAKVSETLAKTSETNAKHSEEEAERWAIEAQEVVIGDILVEGEGDSTTKAMTQKSVTDALNKKWDIQATTGTGNVARMSEVDKKRDKDDNHFYGIDIMLNRGAYDSIGFYLTADYQRGIVSKRSGDVYRYHGLPNKGGDLALTSDIPQITQSLGTSTTDVMSQKAVSDQLKSIESSHGLGYGQQWVNVTSQRVVGTTYTNNTGKPIMVSVTINSEDSGIEIVVDDIIIAQCGQFGGSGNDFNFVQAIIPPQSTYKIKILKGSDNLMWRELR